MNITFFIGNGFDVGMGMHSKFKDFFPIYQVKSKNKPARIKQLSDEIGENYETWADFESALGVYTLKFDEKSKQNFLDQVKDFENEFIEYLKSQESLLSYESNEQIQELLKQALFKYNKTEILPIESVEKISGVYYAHRQESCVYNFINFNYTSVLENCLNCLPKENITKLKNGTERKDIIGKVVHVHGCSDAHPIIGLNDVSQIANEALAQDVGFVRRIVKPTINQLLRCKYDANATSLIQNSNIICIYGMSLGKTDRKWWDMILSWLNSNTERQLILFEYDEKYSASTQFDWLDKEDYIIEKLDDFCTNKTIEVEKLRTRIHISIHKNIFQMDLSEKNKKIMREELEKLLTSA